MLFADNGQSGKGINHMSSGEPIGIDFDSDPATVVEAMRIAAWNSLTYSEALLYLKANGW